MGGYALLSEDGEGILRSGFAHIRHNYNLSNRIQSFEFYQIQFDDVLLIEKRELFGAGLRYNLIKKDSLKIDMELGVMQENERLNPATLNPNETLSTKFIRITAVNSLKYRLSKTVVINNILYYQPRVIDFKDYRLLNDFSLAVSLTEYFEMVTTFTMRYDSQPPSSSKSLDTSVSFGFNLKLSR